MEYPIHDIPGEAGILGMKWVHDDGPFIIQQDKADPREAEKEGGARQNEEGREHGS